ncbi:DNA topoisomerase 3 [Paenibacillus sp. IB182496]|uniref:DNA topoisomerase n=1 Tax=Paenibacillus sabuli TaxID=2772509 RepID=A0A927GU32_9BACL|nr:type IA DNA topoisomerase [Paenibacillus sabuli]MBD2847936.1 DNA topoisomerase 3 [Paenibacillus sabuli]
MKTLIIAEKPDMGRTIAAVVEPGARGSRAYLEGERYIITWAIGHLVGLAEPDRYDARYKKWRAEDLPIIPERFKLWPNPRTKEQLKTIGELAGRCDRLVNACDAGREGQLIFHLICRYLKLKQPADRLWISDLTPETIRRGFDSLRSDTAYDPLTRAARARSEADWLIGMNASRAFTIKHRALLSVGRVQTPVLALLHERHREIEAFRSETYYVVRARFEQAETDGYGGTWQGDRLTDPDKAQAIVDKVKGQSGEIVSYKVAPSREYPYRLYDLTLLQREANGKYGYSAKKTLDLAQRLYEKHKVISYPRTNSNYVTEENVPDMAKTLRMLQHTDYAELANGADPARVHKGNKAVCNPAKVEDHHAILPTPKKPPALPPEEQKLYDMIVRRFLAHYYPPALYDNHEVLTEVAGERFKTKVKQQLDPGWKVVQSGMEAAKPQRKPKPGETEPEETEEELVTAPFQVRKDEPVSCREAELLEKKTQPPKPYTEGTLLKAMETAGKAIEDDELKEAMKDTGLGTPATRAATIERLKQVGYIELSGKRLAITAKGSAAVTLIREAGVELLTSPEMTGRWEQRLHQISKGEASDEPFIAKVKQFAAFIVDKAAAQRPAAAAVFGESEGARAGKGGKGKARALTGGKRAAGEATRAARAGGDAKVAARSGKSGIRPATAAPQRSDSVRQTLAPCPRPGCGGQLIEGRRGFGCTHYKQGCGFVIWKNAGPKTVSATMAKALAQKGETSRLSFKQPDGSSQKGRLVLQSRNDGKVGVQLER